MAKTQEVPAQLRMLKGGGFDPNRVRMVIYGESGVGKTVFGSTAPNPIFLNADDGLASVRLNIASWDIQTWADFLESYEWLSQADHDFETVVVDTLNELQSLGLRDVVDRFPDIRRAYSSLPSMSDYGKMLADMDTMVRMLKSLPMNVLFITQVASQQFDTDLVLPQLTGKSSARNLARMVDVIGYMYKQEDGNSTRAIAFDAVDFVTKDRTGKLPAKLDIPPSAMGWEEVARYWNS